MNNQYRRTEVRLTHLPTGIEVSANYCRSQHQNRESAIQQLRGRMYAMTLEDGHAGTKTYRLPADEPYPEDLLNYRTENGPT